MSLPMLYAYLYQRAHTEQKPKIYIIDHYFLELQYQGRKAWKLHSNRSDNQRFQQNPINGVLRVENFYHIHARHQQMQNGFLCFRWISVTRKYILRIKHELEMKKHMAMSQNIVPKKGFWNKLASKFKNSKDDEYTQSFYSQASDLSDQS